MKHNKAIPIFIALLTLAFIGLIASRMWSTAQPGKYDEFAQCIADSGAQFYGAFWCSHCADQKAMFGNSYKLLPYIECSNEDNSPKEECKAAGVSGYPEWHFPDGTILSGAQKLETLAAQTGCSFGDKAAPSAETAPSATSTDTSSPIDGSMTQ